MPTRCRWLAKDEDDGAIRRRLQALGSPGSTGLTATTTYRVTIYTSDVRGAGTDANVHIQLLGELQDGHQVRGILLLAEKLAWSVGTQHAQLGCCPAGPRSTGPQGPACC